MSVIFVLAGAMIAATAAALDPGLWPLAVALAMIALYLVSVRLAPGGRAPGSELLAWQSRAARQHRAYLAALEGYRGRHRS